MNGLNQSHSREGVKSDQNATILNLHIVDPYLKPHTSDEMGDVWANKYKSHSRISCLMMHGEGYFMAEVKVETINHAKNLYQIPQAHNARSIFSPYECVAQEMINITKDGSGNTGSSPTWWLYQQWYSFGASWVLGSPLEVA